MVSRIKNLVDSQVCNRMQNQGVCKTIQRKFWVESRNKSEEWNMFKIEGILKSWNKRWKKCYKGKRLDKIFEVSKFQIENLKLKLNWLSTKSIWVGCEKYSQISRNNLEFVYLCCRNISYISSIFLKITIVEYIQVMEKKNVRESR
jgi:hypothetical protein